MIDHLKQARPHAPFVLFGYKNERKKIDGLKHSLFYGYDTLNKFHGNNLVRNNGANKYVEYNYDAEYGAKIFIDEIVCAHRVQLKDEEENFALSAIQFFDYFL